MPRTKIQKGDSFSGFMEMSGHGMGKSRNRKAASIVAMGVIELPTESFFTTTVVENKILKSYRY